MGMNSKRKNYRLPALLFLLVLLFYSYFFHLNVSLTFELF